MILNEMKQITKHNIPRSIIIKLYYQFNHADEANPLSMDTKHIECLTICKEINH